MSHAVAAAPSPRVLADVVPRVRARDLALVAGAALLTALCAQISIPVPGSPVPITGQTFAVLLSGAALGAHRGSAAMALYLLLGIVGLPVYADADSGLHVVWGATGGYLVAFPIAGYAIGRLAEARLDRTPLKALPLFTVGSLIVFGIGVPWLAVSAHMTLGQAIDAGFTPFILGGIVKAVLAALLLPAAWRLAR
jgi:biotin transport system substrate-specific component